MNAFFFVQKSAKLRQSKTCSVLLMSDVWSKMITYHPLARTSFVIRTRMRSAIICSIPFVSREMSTTLASEAGY